jgi:hypothetical protein
MTAPIYATPHPGDSAPLHNSSGNVANANAVATLTPANDRLAFLSGFELSAVGATAGLAVVATITGLLGGTLSYIFTFPTGATVGAVPLVVLFDPPIPATAKGTAIVVTLPAGGAGNTNAAACAHGYALP